MRAPAGQHVAHFNHGTLVAPAGDPAVAEFIDAVPAVNAAAERCDGFVWRFPEDEAAACAAAGRHLDGGDGRAIASFSVWRSVEDFARFVHKTVHGRYLARRGDWFEPGQSGMVLWPVDEGHVPDVTEALDRLETLRREGPGPEAFTLAWWRSRVTA